VRIALYYLCGISLSFLNANANPNLKNPKTAKNYHAGQTAYPQFTRSDSLHRMAFEKVYLHTDRDIYTPGDTMWYKAYLTDAQTNVLTASSGTLYVELIGPSANSINTQTIKLKGGLANAELFLNDTLAAGGYRLRAYTSWMRNFGDNFIFEKNIAITAIANDKPLLKYKASVVTKSKTQIAIATVPTASPLVHFYPEGGSLIMGITSLVAVKTDKGIGKGFPASGTVFSAAGDTITNFTCDSLGMGLFALMPLKGQVYHALVKDKSYALPIALTNGLALQVSQTDSVMRVAVRCSDDLPVKSPVKLTVKHGGVTLVSLSLPLTAQQAFARIATSGIPEGVVEVTLYDENNRPNCERLVYIHHPGNLTANVLTDKKAYRPYEKTTVQINAGGPANLSVAVVDAGTTPEQEGNILTYLRLGSEVKGNIEAPRRYFDITNSNRFRQLDLLLLTQGWRDFIWRRLADTAIHISYPAEQGIAISGLVEDEVNHKPLIKSYVGLFTNISGIKKNYGAVTNADGKFFFPDIQFNDKPKVTLNAINGKGRQYGNFIMDTLSSPVVRVIPLQVIAQPDSALAGRLSRRSVGAKLAYSGQQLKEVIIRGRAPANMSSFDKNHIALDNGAHFLTWGDPQSFTVSKNDYWTKTLAWFVQQKFKNVAARADGPGVNILLDGRPKEPILIANGRVIQSNEAELYWNMPIEKIKKIDLVLTIGKPFLFLVTKENAVVDNSGAINVTVNGYYEARTFYAPNYSSHPPSKGDFRNTIHWQPNVKTDINGHSSIDFYNPGAGTMRVIIQGLADNGAIINIETTYQVK
jgi:hypothetical protein